MYWNSSTSNASNPPNKINRNMRCIEIPVELIKILPSIWLIETWDVLKLAKAIFFIVGRVD